MLVCAGYPPLYSHNHSAGLYLLSLPCYALPSYCGPCSAKA